MTFRHYLWTETGSAKRSNSNTRFRSEENSEMKTPLNLHLFFNQNNMNDCSIGHRDRSNVVLEKRSIESRVMIVLLSALKENYSFVRLSNQHGIVSPRKHLIRQLY